MNDMSACALTGDEIHYASQRAALENRLLVDQLLSPALINLTTVFNLRRADWRMSVCHPFLRISTIIDVASTN